MLIALLMVLLQVTRAEDVRVADFNYTDGSTMKITLVGEGDTARVTYVPKGANVSFQRYQGYINQSALVSTQSFSLTKSAEYTILARPGWNLNVSHRRATAALSVGGAVVSADLQAPVTAVGAACDPPGWKGLAPGIAMTVASSGQCLRAARTLSPVPIPKGVRCCTSYQDPASKKPTGPCNISCPAGQTVQSVRFADYGTAGGTCGQLKHDHSCTASNFTAAITTLTEAQCLGKTSCAVTRKAWGDPCFGVNKKRLTISVMCAASTVINGDSSESDQTDLITGVEDEQIFGFGQTVTPGLSAIGSTKFIATFSLTLDTGPSHAPAPSYISLAKNAATNSSVAHGFFLNTHGFSAFDVGANDTQKLMISTPDPVYDYFLFAGPTPAAVIGQFSNVAGGRMSLPPKWAMGMKYDPDESGDNQSFIQSIVEDFADHGVRMDRVVLEPAWQGDQYNWNTAKFTDIAKMIKNITPTKLILWEHPILDQKGEFYTSLQDADCIAHAARNASKSSSGLGKPVPSQFSDLTLPRCQKIWKDYQLKHAIASGADGFKLDEDDVDVNIGFNDSTVFPSGFKGHQFHNIQGYIWQRLYHEMFESLGKRTWLQSRGGYAGSQAYPTNSYSDGYTYTTYVRGVVNSGFSGLIWAPEMRHATCTAVHSDSDHADFARRTQLMFLSPQAQYNAWDGRDGTTVWPCGPKWIDMFRTHYDLRTGLAPYLYSAYESQSRTGIPLARPLVLDSPDDHDTWSIDDQYLLGGALMFPPAGMSGPTSTSRSVYFPRTAPSWHLWFDNSSSFEPGTWATVQTPIMRAPLFVKGGVPVAFRSTAAKENNALGLIVWMPTLATACKGLDADLSWADLYDDDGETTRYKVHGEHWRARAGFVSCLAGKLELRFDISHSSFVVAHKQVHWTVRQVPSVPTRITCSSGGAVIEATWSHSLEHKQLRVLAPLGHSCSVHFLA